LEPSNDCKRSLNDIATVISERERRAKSRHEAVTQELIDNAVVAVDDVNHKAENGVLISDNFFLCVHQQKFKLISTIRRAGALPLHKASSAD
jgi:hypothetical protein